MSALRQGLHDEGFGWWRGGWPAKPCAELARTLDALPPGHAGSRQLLAHPACRAVADTLRQALLDQGVLSADARAVQCTLFEKHAHHNWLVPLHQDLSIPVAQRHAAPGWQGWSLKEGVLFVQPPARVLHTLLAARLHLDACAASDGPLRVVPGSHTQGVIGPERASAQRGGLVDCPAAPGDVLLMRPLLLHASSKARGTSRRRVLHFLFGPARLPDGMAWAEFAADRPQALAV